MISCWSYYYWELKGEPDFCVVQVVPSYYSYFLNEDEQKAWETNSEGLVIVRNVITNLQSPEGDDGYEKPGDCYVLSQYFLSLPNNWHKIPKKDIELTVLSLTA